MQVPLVIWLHHVSLLFLLLLANTKEEVSETTSCFLLLTHCCCSKHRNTLDSVQSGENISPPTKLKKVQILSEHFWVCSRVVQNKQLVY